MTKFSETRANYGMCFFVKAVHFVLYASVVDLFVSNVSFCLLSFACGYLGLVPLHWLDDVMRVLWKRGLFTASVRSEEADSVRHKSATSRERNTSINVVYFLFRRFENQRQLLCSFCCWPIESGSCRVVAAFSMVGPCRLLFSPILAVSSPVVYGRFGSSSPVEPSTSSILTV